MGGAGVGQVAREGKEQKGSKGQICEQGMTNSLVLPMHKVSV